MSTKKDELVKSKHCVKYPHLPSTSCLGYVDKDGIWCKYPDIFLCTACQNYQEWVGREYHNTHDDAGCIDTFVDAHAEGVYYMCSSSEWSGPAFVTLEAMAYRVC